MNFNFSYTEKTCTNSWWRLPIHVKPNHRSHKHSTFWLIGTPKHVTLLHARVYLEMPWNALKYVTLLHAFFLSITAISKHQQASARNQIGRKIKHHLRITLSLASRSYFILSFSFIEIKYFLIRFPSVSTKY